MTCELSAAGTLRVRIANDDPSEFISRLIVYLDDVRVEDCVFADEIMGAVVVERRRRRDSPLELILLHGRVHVDFRPWLP